MIDRMQRLARLSGALAVGLPAAVLGHMAIFGGAHEAGGQFHTLVLDGVTLCVALLAVALGASAAFSAKFTLDGTIVAARLRRCMPSLAAVAASTAAWYELMEGLERAALLPSAIAVLALVCAAALVFVLANALIETVAHAAVAILRAPAPQDLARYCVRFVAAPVTVRASHLFARRFVRPPPSLP